MNNFSTFSFDLYFCIIELKKPFQKESLIADILLSIYISKVSPSVNLSKILFSVLYFSPVALPEIVSASGDVINRDKSNLSINLRYIIVSTVMVLLFL